MIDYFRCIYVKQQTRQIKHIRLYLALYIENDRNGISYKILKYFFIILSNIMNSSHCVVLFLFLAIASLSSLYEASITCYQTVNDLDPCIGYLIGPTRAKPPPACCDGLKTLMASAATKEDKEEACKCIKAATQIIITNYQNAQDLPKYCNIHLPFNITQEMDCSK